MREGQGAHDTMFVWLESILSYSVVCFIMGGSKGNSNKFSNVCVCFEPCYVLGPNIERNKIRINFLIFIYNWKVHHCNFLNTKKLLIEMEVVFVFYFYCIHILSIHFILMKSTYIVYFCMTLVKGRAYIFFSLKQIL